ncbi:MAG: class I SAM-dependent methyltransferase [Candidatus Dormibacteria bacterium]
MAHFAPARLRFSDISSHLLEVCRSLVYELGVLHRCRFVVAGAEELSAIADSSVDVVTTRAVLSYVQTNLRAAYGVLQGAAARGPDYAV